MTKIVFDFGAVVFHWQPAEMLMRELPHIAPDAEKARHWVSEIFQSYGGDWGEFDRGTVSVSELIERISRRTGLPAQDVQRVVDGVTRELQPQAATVALMSRLRQAGHELHYLSNMPAPIASHLEASNDFMHWFKSGIFSGRVQLSKPDPAIYELAAQRFAALPAELLFIDDHPPNIEAARALGWDGFVFSSAEQAAGELALRGLL